MKHTHLADHLEQGRNSFNLVRLTAALAVVYTHSFTILGGEHAAVPLAGFTPGNLGQHAVNVFFVLSGLMLTASIDRRFDLASFLIARARRIFPGLVAASAVLALVIGPLVTTLPPDVYFAHPDTWLYPLRVVAQFANATPLPGVFEHVPLAGQMNEPLWTVRYELLAYLCLAALAFAGLLRTRFGLALATAGALGLYFLRWANLPALADFEFVASIGRFALCFIIGVLSFFAARRLVLSPLILIAALPLLYVFNSGPAGEIAFILYTAYAAFVAGGQNYGVLTRLTSRDDISYGTYLYGWPIQQSLVALFPGVALAAHIALSLVLAAVAGALSWFLVERRALRRSARAAPQTQPA